MFVFCFQFNKQLSRKSRIFKFTYIETRPACVFNARFVLFACFEPRVSYILVSCINRVLTMKIKFVSFQYRATAHALSTQNSRIKISSTISQLNVRKWM